MTERYGAPYTLCSEKLKAKQQNTVIDRYGVDNVMKVPEIHDRAVATQIHRYGGLGFHTQVVDTPYDD